MVQAYTWTIHKNIKTPFYLNSYFGLFKITNAAITPGTQPIIVNNNVITILPHPLSYTAKGGNKMLKITRQMFISYNSFNFN